MTKKIDRGKNSETQTDITNVRMDGTQFEHEVLITSTDHHFHMSSGAVRLFEEAGNKERREFAEDVRMCHMWMCNMCMCHAVIGS